MTALYSINLHIMGKSNVPLLSEVTLATHAEQVGTSALGGATNFNVLGWEVSTRDGAVLIFSFAVIALVGSMLYAFFRTNLGTAMRATGDNAQMIQALGANVGNMIIVGLALANGLIALAGALLAQYQGSPTYRWASAWSSGVWRASSLVRRSSEPKGWALRSWAQ